MAAREKLNDNVQEKLYFSLFYNKYLVTAAIGKQNLVGI